MSWRPSAPAACLAALALLTVVTLAPVVVADHAYSHRYVIFGRVIDAENNPVPGIGPLTPTYSSVFRSEGACANQPGTGTEAWITTSTNPITNQYGEFFFCHHIHSMSRAEPGKVTFEVEGETFEFQFDAFMRYSFAEIKLSKVHPNANPGIVSKTHTIQGRIWESTGASEKIVEDIRVFGDTLHNKPVNITFAYNGKEPIQVETSTNNYGDFAVRVNVTERPTTGTVTVAIEGHVFNETVSPTGATMVRGQIGELAQTNIPAPAAVLALAVLGFLALALRRRQDP